MDNLVACIMYIAYEFSTAGYYLFPNGSHQCNIMIGRRIISYNN